MILKVFFTYTVLPIFLRHGLDTLYRLVSDSWAQAILLPQLLCIPYPAYVELVTQGWMALYG